MTNLITIVGGIILLFIVLGLLKSGMKLMGTCFSIAFLLLLAWLVLVIMGILPDPRSLS